MIKSFKSTMVKVKAFTAYLEYHIYLFVGNMNRPRAQFGPQELKIN